MKRANYLLCFILVLLSIFSACASRGAKSVYDMNKKEAVIWVKQNKIEIPDDLNNKWLGETILSVIKAHKEGYRASNAISYNKTRDFMREIEKKLDSIDAAS